MALFPPPVTMMTGPDCLRHAMACLEISEKIRALYRRIYLTVSARGGKGKREATMEKIRTLYALGHFRGYDKALAGIDSEIAADLVELFGCFDWMSFPRGIPETRWQGAPITAWKPGQTPPRPETPKAKKRKAAKAAAAVPPPGTPWPVLFEDVTDEGDNMTGETDEGGSEDSTTAD